MMMHDDDSPVPPIQWDARVVSPCKKKALCEIVDSKIDDSRTKLNHNFVVPIDNFEFF
jgi:hypothetical protein